MHVPRRLTSAKRKLLREAHSEEWCVGVGIAKIDADVGLMLSVKPGARPAAQSLLKRLAIAVPVQIREVGPIRARSEEASPAPASLAGGELSRLRAAAARRGAK